MFFHKVDNQITSQNQAQKYLKIHQAQNYYGEKMRNVFISFDVDDKHMINLLRSQARDERFPFAFRDYSVKEPFKRGWKKKVGNLIHLSSAVIVAIGTNTHRSKAVNWKIDEAHRRCKHVVGIRLHRNRRCKIPPTMNKDDKITYWNTDKISYILGSFK